MVKLSTFSVPTVGLRSNQTGKHMTKHVILAILALLTLTCAVLEGLFDWLPPQFIQFNGLLAIVCTGALIGWTFKTRADSLDKD